MARIATKDTYGVEHIPTAQEGETIDVRRQIKAGAVVPDEFEVDKGDTEEVTGGGTVIGHRPHQIAKQKTVLEDPDIPESTIPPSAEPGYKDNAARDETAELEDIEVPRLEGEEPPPEVQAEGDGDDPDEDEDGDKDDAPTPHRVTRRRSGK